MSYNLGYRAGLLGLVPAQGWASETTWAGYLAGINQRINDEKELNRALENLLGVMASCER